MSQITKTTKKTITNSSSRADKALALVKSVIRNTDGTTFTVPSQSCKTYQVSPLVVTADGQTPFLYTCTCPDHQHRGSICKHIQAVKLSISQDENELHKQIRKKAFDAETKERQDVTSRYVDEHYEWRGGFD